MSETINWDAEVWNDRYQQIAEGAVPDWQSLANPHVVELVGKLPAGSALDVACGTGRNTVWLASQGWQAHGVDFSNVGLGLAGRRAAELGVPVTLHCGDINDGWQPGQQFDLVLLCYLHYRHHGVAAVIATLADWVSPGGTLMVVGFDESSHPLPFGGPSLSHQFYSVDLLTSTMTTAGLEVFHAAAQPRVISSDDGDTAVIHDTVVLARSGIDG